MTSSWRWRSSCCWASRPSWCGAPAPRSPPSAPPTPRRSRPPARRATCPRASPRRGAPPSGATRAPVVAGPAVVTGDGGLVAGHDADPAPWPGATAATCALCTVGAGFPGADDGDGHALALYEGRTGWCSELTALPPSSGRRADASNPDMRPGVQLLADGSYVIATGTDYLEVWRSDLVRTLEYGDVPTPVQPGKQPRPECTYGSIAISSDRHRRRSSGAPTRPPTGSPCSPRTARRAPTHPRCSSRSQLPATGAVLVALSGDRAAVAVPGPPRLMCRQGRAAGRAGAPRRPRRRRSRTDPPGAHRHRDHRRLPRLLVGGRATVALDVEHAHTSVDAARHPRPACRVRHRPPGAGPRRPRRARPRARHRAAHAARCRAPTPPPPVRLAAAGEMLLEQRGAEVVALLPTR